MGSDSEQQDQLRDRAIAAILSTRTFKEAARECEIPPSTFYRLTRTPEFEAALREARVHVFENAMARLQALASDAVDVVEQTMKGQIRDNTQLRAALVVIEHGRSELSLEERIKRLERGR